MREKRAEWIRQSRWLWIRLVWQGEKTEEAGKLVFFVSGEASWNECDRKKVRVVETRREWRNYTVVNIMALEFKSGDSDVTG